MVNLKKILKSNLITIIENKNEKIDRYADQLIVEGGKRVGLEDEIKKLLNRIEDIKRSHDKQLLSNNKAVLELKMQIKNDSKRFDGINSAIDTVAEIKYPNIPLLALSPEDIESDVIFDDQFYMLRHFKRLVAPNNVTDYTANRFGERL